MHQTKWFARLVAVALLASGSLGLTLPASAQQKGGGTTTTPTTTPPGVPVPPGPTEVHSWALAPGDGTKQAGERPNLSYELPPGGVADDVVTLYNFSNVPLTFNLYATDAYNNEDGAFDLLPFDQKPKDVGKWFTLGASTLTVPAGKQASFPIRVKVPPDARPGDHAGAVLASSFTEGTGPEGDVINVDRRTGSRVYVRVAGPTVSTLAVENLRTTYKPTLNPLSGTATVHYRVRNTGNVRLAAVHQASVGGPLGLGRKSAEEETITELLPGESVDIEKAFDGVPATVVAVTHVDLQPQALGGRSNDLEPSSRKGYDLAIPFALLALVLILILLSYARSSYRRHREEDTRIPVADGAP